ncbi:MAG TPA: DNA primase [Kofleriaceae bacterium]
MIADEIINEIRSRADIVAVIGQHVQLKKAGRNWKGLCPFHGEKTPSFNVSADKGFFHCFGCQKHGDVFTFVMELEGKSFVEAAEQLGARFGVAVPKVDESPELRKARGERVAMLDINRAATEFFREILADAKRGEAGRAYLAKRGVAADVTDKFQLGYAPPDWHALNDYLKAKRLDLELAARLGLVAKQPRAGGYYDRYRDRLVCPVIVPGGEIVGFSARVIGAPPPSADGSEPPKYINSPESSVYKKSKLLFGLAQAREGMQKAGRAVLVEGNFDVISLHQAGFSDVVAPLGTALTIEQVLTLKRLTDRVVLLYDGDKAGEKATMHALQMCVEAEVEVLVAKRPGNAKSGGGGVLADGMDPDSLVASGGSEQLREAIDRAQGGIEFFCFEVWGKARANADAKTRALEDAARLAIHIENPIKRDLVIDTTAKALEVETSVVRTAVARAAANRASGGGQSGGRSGYQTGGYQSGGPSGGPSGYPSGGRGGYPSGGRGDAGRGPSHPNAPGGHPNAPAGHPYAPDEGSGGSDGRNAGGPEAQRGNPTGNAGKTPGPPPTEEIELISLLAAHPSLIATAEADKAFWLLTDERVRSMYSAARAGQSFLELAPVQLPPPSAKQVLSGKYSESKDPRAVLLAMIAALEQKQTMLAHQGLQKSLVEAKRGGGDPELVRLQTHLAIAQRKGDRELVEQLMEKIASNRKQAE